HLGVVPKTSRSQIRWIAGAAASVAMWAANAPSRNTPGRTNAGRSIGANGGSSPKPQRGCLGRSAVKRPTKIEDFRGSSRPHRLWSMRWSKLHAAARTISVNGEACPLTFVLPDPHLEQNSAEAGREGYTSCLDRKFA